MSTPADGPGRDEGTTMPDLDELLTMLEQSSSDRLSDPESGRRELFGLLAESDDPMWREIGQQLRDGQMSPRQILQVDAYWQHVERGLVAHQEDFRQAVEAVRDHSQAERGDGGHRDPDRDAGPGHHGGTGYRGTGA